jgi:hypothetical protein
MSIASDLNGFTHLKHVCLEEYRQRFEHDIRNFASQARNLAKAVPGLVTITNVSPLNQSHTVAKITRGENEQVASVKVRNGCGMKTGYEDQAFPAFP